MKSHNIEIVPFVDGKLVNVQPAMQVIILIFWPSFLNLSPRKIGKRRNAPPNFLTIIKFSIVGYVKKTTTTFITSN